MKKLLLILLMAVSGWSATYYVRSGATGAGTGADWTNAYTSLPSTLERGSTYYIAGGTYPIYRFDDLEKGDTVITIKKATESDHGTDIGWNNIYAINQAIFTASKGPIFEFRTGYYTIDGVSGFRDKNHGIKLYNPANISAYAGGCCVMVASGYTSKHIELNHIEMESGGWAGTIVAPDTMARNQGIYAPGVTGDWVVKNCYIHNCGQQWVLIAHPTPNYLFDNCYFKNGGSGNSALHSVGFWILDNQENMNIIIRNNIFENFSAAGGTGYISMSYRATETPVISGGYKIYGNIFKETDPLAGPSRLIGTNGGGYGAPIVNDVIFYNNTICNLHGALSSRITFQAVGSNVIATNNIWYNCEASPLFINITESNNIKNDLEYNPFIDTIDFRLDTTLAGANINSDSIDPSNIIRGEDGVWDIGAYEYSNHAVISNNTIYNAKGQRLRGGTFWLYGWIPSKTLWALTDTPWTITRDSGFNVIRLACGYRPERVDNYSLAKYDTLLDSMVIRAERFGIYVVIDYHPTPGYYYNTTNNISSDTYENNKQHAIDFWMRFANRYKNKKNVIFELINEPIFDGPNDYSPNLLKDFNNLWKICDSIAPSIPVIMMSYCQVGDHVSQLLDWPTYKTNQLEGINWNKTLVGFHSYWRNSSERIQHLKQNYPCVNTEFMTYPNAGAMRTMDGYDRHGTLMETLGISWFQWDILDRPENLGRLDTVIADLRANNLMWSINNVNFGGSISYFHNSKHFKVRRTPTLICTSGIWKAMYYIGNSLTEDGIYIAHDSILANPNQPINLLPRSGYYNRIWSNTRK